MKCVILAAGKGSRLGFESKPATKLLGVSLIERVIRNFLSELEIDEFIVVVGYNKDIVKKELENLEKKLNIKIKLIENENYELENGYSLLCTKEYLKGEKSFYLAMSDHYFEPKILKNLNGLEDGFTYLLTDTNLSNDIIDLEDVTKVKFDQNGYILDIGKKIEEYNGFDSGIFLCSNEIFDSLQSCKEETTLSSAIKILAEKRKVKIIKFNGFWIDIDTKTELKKAEKFLLSNLTKENDGFISKHLNRKVSLFFTKYLVKFNLTPNQISLFSFILSIIGSLVLANSGYLSLLFGGILVQLASIIDGCDGEIARLKYQSSEFGGWFDAVLDRYSDSFILFALTYHQFMIDKSESTLIIGFLAIIGSFVLSYTADKYDKRFKSKFNFRIGRDLRIFTVFVGAVLNLALFTLILIAIVMNIEVIRRILIVKR